MRNLKFVSLLSVLLVAAFISSASANSGKLVGTWRTVLYRKGSKTKKPSAKVLYTFKKGGALTMSQSRGSRSKKLAGKWTLKGSKLKLVVKGRTMAMKISIKGKKMVWDQGGMIQELRRQ